MNIICPHCAITNWANAVNCKRCNYPLQEVGLNSNKLNSETINKPLTNQPPQHRRMQVDGMVAPHLQIYSQKREQPLQTQQLNQTQALPTSQQIPQSSTQSTNLPPAQQVRQIQPVNNQIPIGKAPANSMNFVIEREDVGLGGSLLTRILFLPFTVVARMFGFLYSHKKIALLLIGVPAVIAAVTPNLLEAIKKANESSAIATIKVLTQAQMAFMSSNRRCGDLKELEKTKLIDPSVASGKKSGYVFTILSLPGGCEIYSKPEVLEGLTSTGNRSFYFSTRDNTLRFSEDKTVLATATSPGLDTGVTESPTIEKPKIASSK